MAHSQTWPCIGTVSKQTTSLALWKYKAGRTQSVLYVFAYLKKKGLNSKSYLDFKRTFIVTNSITTTIAKFTLFPFQFPGFNDAGLAYIRELNHSFPRFSAHWDTVFNAVLTLKHPEFIKLVLKRSGNWYFITSPIIQPIVFSRYRIRIKLLVIQQKLSKLSQLLPFVIN